MRVKLKANYISLTFLALFSLTVSAEKTFDIPVMDDAIIFADFNDKIPAVINYFTSMTVADITGFYKIAYGEISYQEAKRGRLTLAFHPDNLIIRFSMPMIDQPAAGTWSHTSTVVTTGATCPAPKQDGKCGDCRRCWDKSIPNIAYGKH